MDKPNREILINYFLGKCSEEQNAAIDIYLALKIDNDFVDSCLQEAFDQSDADEEGDKSGMERVWMRLQQKQIAHQRNTTPRIRPFRMAKVAAAAAIVLLATTFALVRFQQAADDRAGDVADITSEILAGGDNAVLTLADGSTISLSDRGNGMIAEQQGLSVRKTSDGEIVYQQDGSRSNNTKAYNTITTPKGGQFSVVLPDGSKAKLNAASSLSYPVQFDDNERHVKMTGEVYFEVTKAKQLDSEENTPFVVETDKQTITVLGTTFNVNAYRDEPAVRTVLVEGLVRVTASSSGKSLLMQPGQEVWVDDHIMLKKADLKEQLAWVQGDFIFQKEELQSILRKVSRWYNVEVDCPVDLGRVRFSGMLSRQQPLAEVVEAISSMQKVNLTVKGRRIIVTP